MKKTIPNTPNWTALRGGRKLIDSVAFTAHLRERGHAPGTIREYRRRVAVVAYRLSEQNLRLASLRGAKVSSLLQRYLPRGAADGNFRMHRAAINSWLKFKGCFAGRRPAYQGWLSDFLDFLTTHRGLAASTRENYRYRLIDYLAWQCGGTRPDWSKIQVEDIWRYAEHCTSVNQPFTVAGKLMVVRQFLRFVQLRGAGSPVLACVQGRFIKLHGKGRKDRTVPIQSQLTRQLQRFVTINRLQRDQPIFANRHGTVLTREGVALRLDLAVRRAEQTCPSLREHRITPHVWRHTTAMHLLHAGVPIEVIALWLGHEQPITTHTYVQADLTLKDQCARLLDKTRAPRPRREPAPFSRLLSFLEAQPRRNYAKL